LPISWRNVQSADANILRLFLALGQCQRDGSVDELREEIGIEPLAGLDVGDGGDPVVAGGQVAEGEPAVGARARRENAPRLGLPVTIVGRVNDDRVVGGRFARGVLDDPGDFL
jgi:hypothetical protein